MDYAVVSEDTPRAAGETKEGLKMNQLAGYKTYIAAAAIGIVTALQYAGVISDEMFQSIVGALTALGLIVARVGTVKG